MPTSPHAPRHAALVAAACRRIEAETIAWSHGVETEPVEGKAGNMAVHTSEQAAYIQLKNVDFGSSAARTFGASVMDDQAGAGLWAQCTAFLSTCRTPSL